jgi:hypothetical protein
MGIPSGWMGAHRDVQRPDCDPWGTGLCPESGLRPSGGPGRQVGPVLKGPFLTLDVLKGPFSTLLGRGGHQPVSGRQTYRSPAHHPKLPGPQEKPDRKLRAEPLLESPQFP